MRKVSAREANASSWFLLLVGFLALRLCLPASHAVAADSDDARAKDKQNELELTTPVGRSDSLIKIIQRKSFMKVDRLELTAYLGGETINPFVYQWIGGLGATYHMTEVFAIEGYLGYSPSLSAIVGAILSPSPTIDNLDFKDLTIELENSASVRPSTTKMGFYGSADMVFSPLYGKFAFMSSSIVNFDVYFLAGLGAIQTRDLDVNYQGEAIEFERTTREVHFASNVGFGFRGAFNEWMAFRLEGREYFFVESVTVGDEHYSQETLNVMYYFVAQAGLSFFFPTSLR